MSSSQPQTASLFGIAQETRDMIYTFVITTSRTQFGHNQQLSTIAPLLVNKQMSSEFKKRALEFFANHHNIDGRIDLQAGLTITRSPDQTNFANLRAKFVVLDIELSVECFLEGCKFQGMHQNSSFMKRRQYGRFPAYTQELASLAKGLRYLYHSQIETVIVELRAKAHTGKEEFQYRIQDNFRIAVERAFKREFLGMPGLKEFSFRFQGDKGTWAKKEQGENTWPEKAASRVMIPGRACKTVTKSKPHSVARVDHHDFSKIDSRGLQGWRELLERHHVGTREKFEWRSNFQPWPTVPTEYEDKNIHGGGLESEDEGY